MKTIKRLAWDVRTFWAIVVIGAEVPQPAKQIKAQPKPVPLTGSLGWVRSLEEIQKIGATL